MPPLPLGRRRVRALVAAVVAAAVATSAAACGAPQPATGTVAFPAGSTMAELARQPRIKVGASANQPGLAELNLQLDWEGFNIDLAALLVESLGRSRADIDWVNTTAANRIPYIKQNKIDFFTTALAITPARVKTISIAGPYMEATPRLMVRKARIADFGSLSGIPTGTKICVLQGSQGQPRVKKDIPQASISEFNTLTNCVRALEQGTVDAVDSTAPLLAGFVAAKPDLLALSPMSYGDGEKWGIGVSKQRSDLCRFFNDKLRIALEDGTIERLWKKHMGPSGLDAPGPPQSMTSC